MSHPQPDPTWHQPSGVHDRTVADPAASRHANAETEELSVVLNEACIEALTKLASAKNREDAAEYERAARRTLGARRQQLRGLLEALCSRAEELEKYQQLAQVDELTGMANRRAFNTALRRELARARRSGKPLALLLMDLDGLKHINDSSGHLAGDRAIVALAECCAASVRTSDTIARLGGDEFAVLLPDTDTDGAQATIQRVRQRAKATFVAGGSLRVSIGWSVTDPYLKTPSALFASADAELYRDKAAHTTATHPPTQP